jgi:hypothetical protein
MYNQTFFVNHYVQVCETQIDLIKIYQILFYGFLSGSNFEHLRIKI